jgi:hypothetical protein
MNDQVGWNKDCLLPSGSVAEARHSANETFWPGGRQLRVAAILKGGVAAEKQSRSFILGYRNVSPSFYLHAKMQRQFRKHCGTEFLISIFVLSEFDTESGAVIQDHV